MKEKYILLLHRAIKIKITPGFWKKYVSHYSTFKSYIITGNKLPNRELSYVLGDENYNIINVWQRI